MEGDLFLDKLKKYEEAIEDFTKSIDIDKNNAAFWFNRASSFRNSGFFNEAIQDFTIAIELDSSNPVLYSNRGQVYRKMELYNKAHDDYLMEINNGSGNLVKAYNNKAFCNAKLGNFEEAVEDYTNVLGLDPMNAHALHNRGISNQRLNKLEEVTILFYYNVGSYRFHFGNQARPYKCKCLL